MFTGQAQTEAQRGGAAPRSRGDQWGMSGGQRPQLLRGPLSFPMCPAPTRDPALSVPSGSTHRWGHHAVLRGCRDGD